MFVMLRDASYITNLLSDIKAVSCHVSSEVIDVIKII